MSYQKVVLLQTFVCWVINLAVSELSFEVSFVLSSPLVPSCLPGVMNAEKKAASSVRLLPIHHSSNHLIRAVFDVDCIEWQ